jgi:glyoxylase-like metal-dependent hydrolase (beta-lactamase superfamily II)
MTEQLAYPAYEVLRPVLPHAAVLLANNPGTMELEGTNTWLLRDEPTRREAVVVDPGPLMESHLQRIVEEAGSVKAIVLTHRHDDHTGGAKRLHEMTGAPVYAVDPTFRLGSEGLGEGDVLSGAGIDVHVMLTPGHTTDSVSLLLGAPGEPEAILTGDMVLGRGTTVVAFPDGALEPYLASIDRMRMLGNVPVLPGHGPELTSIGDIAAYYLEHRRDRLRQVREARERLGLQATARQIVEVVYTDVPDAVKRAATSSTKAQLAYLDMQDGREQQSGRQAYASEEEVAADEAEDARRKAEKEAKAAAEAAQQAQSQQQ